MNGYELAALVVVSVVAFDLGFLATVIVCHRLRKTPRCHFCDLHPALDGNLYCSAICADLDLGLLGATL